MNLNRLIAILLPFALKYILRRVSTADAQDPAARNLTQRAGQIAKLTRRLF